MFKVLFWKTPEKRGRQKYLASILARTQSFPPLNFLLSLPHSWSYSYLLMRYSNPYFELCLFTRRLVIILQCYSQLCRPRHYIVRIAVVRDNSCLRRHQTTFVVYDPRQLFCVDARNIFIHLEYCNRNLMSLMFPKDHRTATGSALLLTPPTPVPVSRCPIILTHSQQWLVSSPLSSFSDFSSAPHPPLTSTRETRRSALVYLPLTNEVVTVIGNGSHCGDICCCGGCSTNIYDIVFHAQSPEREERGRGQSNRRLKELISGVRHCLSREELCCAQVRRRVSFLPIS